MDLETAFLKTKIALSDVLLGNNLFGNMKEHKSEAEKDLLGFLFFFFFASSLT